MDIVTYALSKKYTQKSLDGLGALKGANCVIESIDTVPEGNRVTFSWTGTDGTIETSTMIVENGIDGNNGANGADGVSISKIEKINTVGLVDTYRITFTDNTTYDYSVTNGQKGEQGIQGLRGEKGEQGEQGVQGVQGIQGEKGDDGYPFLIYKEYSDISEFNKNDFPEIGLMFMIKADDATSFPVYRYTGDESVPYRYVTNLTGGEGIKGEKGDKGEQGQQGVQGENGKDGITYIPTIGTVTSGDIASATVIVDDKTSTAEFSFVLPKGDNVTVDTILSNTSENPVQNKVIKQAIDNKADKTTATKDTNGLMSAEDKSKLDAFEITTTGGKLHDKDIATTDLIPTSLPANGGNADTVGGHTVMTDVPENAVFTDTVPDLSGYAKKTDIPTSLPANGGNADTVGGLHANDFTKIIDFGYTETDTKTAIGQLGKTTIYRCTKWTDYPAEFIDSQGTLITVNYAGTGTVGTDTLWCTQIIVNPRSGNKMFIRYIDAKSVSDWKEISTTPIKSTTVSGTTDAYSNIALWAKSENKIPILFECEDKNATIFYGKSSIFYAYVTNRLHQDVVKTAVSGTVWYVEV